MSGTGHSRMRILGASAFMLLGWVLFFVEVLAHEDTGSGYWCLGLASLMYMLTLWYWLSFLDKRPVSGEYEGHSSADKFNRYSLSSTESE